jgi:hypothetical protein
VSAGRKALEKLIVSAGATLADCDRALAALEMLEAGR